MIGHSLRFLVLLPSRLRTLPSEKPETPRLSRFGYAPLGAPRTHGGAFPSATAAVTARRHFVFASQAFKEELAPLKHDVRAVNELSGQLTPLDVHLSPGVSRQLDDLNMRWKLLQVGLSYRSRPASSLPPSLSLFMERSVSVRSAGLRFLSLRPSMHCAVVSSGLLLVVTLARCVGRRALLTALLLFDSGQSRLSGKAFPVNDTS